MRKLGVPFWLGLVSLAVTVAGVALAIATQYAMVPPAMLTVGIAAGVVGLVSLVISVMIWLSSRRPPPTTTLTRQHVLTSAIITSIPAGVVTQEELADLFDRKRAILESSTSYFNLDNRLNVRYRLVCERVVAGGLDEVAATLVRAAIEHVPPEVRRNVDLIACPDSVANVVFAQQVARNLNKASCATEESADGTLRLPKAAQGKKRVLVVETLTVHDSRLETHLNCLRGDGHEVCGVLTLFSGIVDGSPFFQYSRCEGVSPETHWQAVKLNLGLRNPGELAHEKAGRIIVPYSEF